MKAKIITLKDNELSERVAKDCIAQAAKFGVSVEIFDAINGFDANFHLDSSKNIGIFKEKFNFHNKNKPRKQEHIFYMETEDDILTRAQQIGFIIQGKIDLMKCAYDYQYLYILTKPS